VITAVLVAVVAVGANTLVSFAGTQQQVAKAWAAALTPHERFMAFQQAETLQPEFQQALFYSFASFAEVRDAFVARMQTYVQVHQLELNPAQLAVFQKCISRWAVAQSKDDFPPDIDEQFQVDRKILGDDLSNLFTLNGGVVLYPKMTVRGVYALPVAVRIKSALAGAGNMLATMMVLHAFCPYGDCCNCNQAADACPDENGLKGHCDYNPNCSRTGGIEMDGCIHYEGPTVCDRVCRWAPQDER
jgi:hypothetical protein